MLFTEKFYIKVLKKIKRIYRNPKHVILRRFHPEIREQERLSKLTGPSGYWEELRSYQINFLKTMGLQPHHSLLDIGCGPLQGGIAFIDYLDANKYTGVDITDIPITEAYRQILKYKLVNKNPQLVISNSFGLEELKERQYDYIWTCQMLYHLDTDFIYRYFESVYPLLKPNGMLYADILGQECALPEYILWNGFRHLKHKVEFMEKTAEKYSMKMTCIGKIKDYGYPVPTGLRFNDMLKFEKK